MIPHMKGVILIFGFVGISSAFTLPNVDTKKCLKRKGLFPKPGSLCKGYYDCSNWIPDEKQCPEDQHFNANDGFCDSKEIYPCFEKPKRKECPRENGRFPKPGTKCKSFYKCCNGEPTEQTCPQAQLFDPSTEDCQWSKYVICDEGISSTDMSTSTTHFTIFTSTTTRSDQDKSTSKVFSLSTPTETSPVSTSQLSTSTAYQTMSTMLNSSSTRHPSSIVFTPSTLGKVSSEMTTKEISPFTPTILLHSTATESTSISPSIPASDSTTIDKFRPTNTITESYFPETPSSTESTASSTETKGITHSPLEIFVTESTTKVEFQTTITFTESPLPETASSTEDTVSSTKTKGTDHTPLELFLTESTTVGSTSIVKNLTPIEEVLSSTVFKVIVSSEMPRLLCPEPFGYFPHPTDKHKFVGCVDDIPSVLTCPSDLIYKHEMRRCDYQDY